MTTSVESGAHLVAPPFKREWPDVDHVAVENTRSREHSIDAQRAQASHDLGQGSVVGEVLEPYGAYRRSSVDDPRVGGAALDGDLIRERRVHASFVRDAFDLLSPRLTDARSDIYRKSR